MDRIYLKSSIQFLQTGQAVRDYLYKKGIESDLVVDDTEFNKRKHNYSKVIELENIDCVNTTIFTENSSNDRIFDTFYYGSFSGKKVIELSKSLVHIYYRNRWPIHSYIGNINTVDDLLFLANKYKNFRWFDGDEKWVYQSLVYSGCNPLDKKDIDVLTVDEYVKSLPI